MGFPFYNLSISMPIWRKESQSASATAGVELAERAAGETSGAILPAAKRQRDHPLLVELKVCGGLGRETARARQDGSITDHRQS